MIPVLFAQLDKILNFVTNLAYFKYLTANNTKMYISINVAFHVPKFVNVETKIISFVINESLVVIWPEVFNKYIQELSFIR